MADRILVHSKPTSGYMRDWYPTESGARWYRKCLIGYNSRYEPNIAKQTIIYKAAEDRFEVWILPEGD